jgi:Flp pilus assembly protein TadG
MLKEFLRRDEGSELLEAAFVLPIFVLVMLAAVNLGMVVYAGQMANEAARHGVRMGSVSQSNQAGIAVSAAQDFAQTAFAVGHPRVDVLAPGGLLGSKLKLRVTYTVPNFLAGLGSLFPGIPSGQFVVSGEATMRQEGWLR